MVDRAWVYLCRADHGYEKGASEFIRDVAAALGDVDMIVCPCIDCRNIDRHASNVVVDHLVTRGTDEAYKSIEICRGWMPRKLNMVSELDPHTLTTRPRMGPTPDPRIDGL
ncbi:unnamed protein product [Microthlaspi erraticum]|uniref:Transposase-associated domain-containing protein n=1 Tax=Microthlaspi erraticum TaxID=1685480 RepID=A0A6D2JVC9_9BRAS|nr:unnamed protein product [Microthlaspi erraticum]